MSKLPKNTLPIFDIYLLSLDKKVFFHPMTLKEEKILLIAKQSDDVDEIIRSVKQLITNCVVDDIDVNKMPLFDIEYLLINIISKSVSDKFEFSFNDDDTGEKIDAMIDIKDINIFKHKEHKNPVKVSDNVTIKFNYPGIDAISFFQAAYENPIDRINIIMTCIDKIFIDDTVNDGSDFNQQELIEFFESLTLEQLKSIEQFFSTIPTLRYEYKYKNSTGKEKSLVIEGLKSFFTYR